MHGSNGVRYLFQEFPTKPFAPLFVPGVPCSDVGFRILADDETHINFL
jgi:hypothetical protein